jgi:hypothetical protein
MEVERALLLGSLLLAVGVTVDAAEFIVARHVNSRAFDWQIIRTRFSRRPGPRSWVRGALDVTNQVGRIVAVWVIPGGLILSAPAAAAFAALISFALALRTQRRLTYGLDGADQMALIVMAGILVALVSPTWGVVLIAGQSLLSYVTAGVSKLFGERWRRGDAVLGITNTVGYGSARVRRLLRTSGRGRALAWGTIAFEVAGPLLLLAGPQGAMVFVLAAFVFHVSIAAAMGLNNFVWSFVAALPAVYCLGSWIG